MHRTCGWCGLDMGHDDSGEEGETTGICPPCYAKQIAKLDALLAATQPVTVVPTPTGKGTLDELF